MDVVLATANPHKLQEIGAICGDCGINFVLPDSNFNPVEDGATFEENSLIKAKEAYRISGNYTLADDSGLCVDVLNGAPGLYSSRYAGTQEEKINKLLTELDGKTPRTAKFVCCLTFLDDNGNLIFQTTEECKGEIVLERKGINGFGYDPIFIVEDTGKTASELLPEEKDHYSHRGRAARKMKLILGGLEDEKM